MSYVAAVKTIKIATDFSNIKNGTFENYIAECSHLAKQVSKAVLHSHTSADFPAQWCYF